jgi:carbon storage regulator
LLLRHANLSITDMDDVNFPHLQPRKEDVMLVLSRKPEEKILIADHIAITVLSVHGNRVRLGIDAPPNCRVLRSELDHRFDEQPFEDMVPDQKQLEPVGA